jgi:peptidoglycan/LPS O-acetylase OafA/YrhL
VALLLIYGFVYSTLRLGGLPGQFIDFFSLNYGCAVPLAIVIFGVARYRSWLSALLSLPWIVWLGDISFSIYAVHTWTVRPFIRPAVDINAAYGIDAIFRIVMAIAFTVIVAAATYVIIEVPCRRYLRAKLMRHDRRATRDVPAESAAAPMQA